MSHFRLVFKDRIRFNWQLGVILILLFGIPRFLIVLQANRTGNYNFTSVLFLFMWALPFILLSKQGRVAIGLRKVKCYKWLLLAFILGIMACTVIYLTGQWLYGSTIHNWFVYISKSFTIPPQQLEGNGRTIFFLIFALISMSFSPIGEELLYRGLIHQSFADRFSEHAASRVDSLAFAITHLPHFGIIYTLAGWQFPFVAAVLWMSFMFLSSRLFFYCKYKSGSLYGAMLAHAGFNLAMIYFIFYHML
jgi:uncharacterized protein